jgi:hypothetical protein
MYQQQHIKTVIKNHKLQYFLYALRLTSLNLFMSCYD